MADPKTGELANPEDFEVPGEPKAEEKPPKDIGYVKTARDKAREEMAKRAQKRREIHDKAFQPDVLQEDGTITSPPVQALPELTTDSTQELVEPTAAEVPTQEVPPTSQSEAAPSSEPPTAPEEERELIVDGKRIKVPLSRILDAGTRTLQKETAADMRLAAATELLKSAQERQAAPQQATQPQQVQPSDEDAQLARSIQFGTEEEARIAIAKLRHATPSITPQQIDAYVQQKLAQALPEHQAFHEANSWLRTNYNEITDDPDLKFLFDTKEQQARTAGDRRPYKELYQDLAGQIATKFHLKKAEKAQAPQPLTTTASDRLARKSSSPRPVTGASGRVEQPPQERKAPTVSEYVSQQRQRRGLQPLDKQGI